MKRIISTIIAVVSCAVLYGQDFWRDNLYLNRTAVPGDSTFSFVAVEGIGNFGSDGLHSDFLVKSWRGGFLDSTYIENAASQLLPVNRIGLHASTGITYGVMLHDSANSLLTFSLLNRVHVSGKFTDDAFRLGYQGNTRYKGQEADISGTRFTSLTWTQLKIGYATQETKNSAIAVSFSVLAGNSYNEVNVHHGKLFTDSQGLFVDGSIASDYYTSDTSNTSVFALNGFGTAVDITWMYQRNVKGGNEVYRLDCYDFGFINWNNKMLHRYADTTFHYEGIDISQIFTDPAFVAEAPESKDFIKTDTTTTNRSTFLPAVVRGTYTRSFRNESIGLKASAALPLWSYALPYGSITMRYSVQKARTTFSGGIAYGGYSAFQVPIKVELWMIKNTTVEIGTTNALVFINPEKLSGCGAFLKLCYCL